MVLLGGRGARGRVEKEQGLGLPPTKVHGAPVPPIMPTT